MGIRVRKSFKIAPGVRLNLGKRSSSISIGNKYGHTTISSSQKKRSSGYLQEDIEKMMQNQENVSEKKRKGDRIFLKVCGIIMYIVAAIALLMTIAIFGETVIFGFVFLIPTVIAFLIGRFFISLSKH